MIDFDVGDILDDLAPQYGITKIVGLRGDEYVAVSMRDKAPYRCATFSIAALRQINEYQMETNNEHDSSMT